MTIQNIRKLMIDLLIHSYPFLDIISSHGRYTVDDIINQVMMENIIKEYQLYTDRCSIRQHCIDLDMINGDESDSAAILQKYSRIVQKANEYKSYYNDELKNSGVTRYDPTTNYKSGPSNWQNEYSLTEADFHELVMQSDCIVLKKIFEHKISSKKGFPNPKFEDAFNGYSAQIKNLHDSMNTNIPSSVISKTSELFNLHRQYNIEFFYNVTLAAEAHKSWKVVPKERLLLLCGNIPIIPSTEYFPYTLRGIESRFLMKRNIYIDDVFEKNDKEWGFQSWIITEMSRLAGFLNQINHGFSFIKEFHEICEEEKVDFIKKHYWLWDKNIESFDWTNRKRIQYMRDLYDVMTINRKKS